LRLSILALALALASAGVLAQDVMVPPVKTVDVKPVYTPEAMRARIYGNVVLTFDVLVDGTTSNFRIVKSLDPLYGLDQQAIEAVKQWRFRPATKNGVPIRAQATASVGFGIRDRDSTVLAAPVEPVAPVVPGAPVSTWPPSFANDIADPGATWKPDSVKLGDATLHFESPAGWTVRNYPQGNLLLGMMGAQGRRMVMAGAAMKTPGPMMLPLPPSLIDGFGKNMAAAPAMQKATLRSSGQVQIGSKWWLWLELTPAADMLNQMPPEMREALAGHDFSEIRLWSFITGVDNEMVQIMMFDWLPSAAVESDVELRNATSTFRVILSKMSFSKEGGRP